MSASNPDNPDLRALQNDLAALRRDLSNLMAHVKTGATNSAQNAAGQIDDGVLDGSGAVLEVASISGMSCGGVAHGSTPWLRGLRTQSSTHDSGSRVRSMARMPGLRTGADQ